MADAPDVAKAFAAIEDFFGQIDRALDKAGRGNLHQARVARQQVQQLRALFIAELKRQHTIHDELAARLAAAEAKG